MSAKRKPYGCLACLLLTLLSAISFVVFNQPSHPDTAPVEPIREITIAQSNRVVESKDLGLALLAEQKFDAAADKFSEVTAIVPDEALGWMNLAIARLLAARQKKRDDGNSLLADTLDANLSETVVAATQAKDELLERLDSSAHAHWVAAQVALLSRDGTKEVSADPAVAVAVTELQRAAAISSLNVAARFGIYELAYGSSDISHRTMAVDALRQAYSLQPGNLKLLVEMLTVQIDLRDQLITETLAAVKQKSRLLRPDLREEQQADIDEITHQVGSAVATEDWQVVFQQATRLRDALAKHNLIAQDLKRLTPSPLELTIQDFTPSFYFNNTPTPLAKTPAAQVAFQQIKEATLSQQTNALDVHMVDIPGDGNKQLAVLRPGSLTLLGCGEGGRHWRTLASVDVPAGMSHIAATSDLVVYGAAGLSVFGILSQSADGQTLLKPVDQTEAFQKLRNVLSVAPLDCDQAGDLDLAISTTDGLSLWANTGGSKFQDITDKCDLDTGLTPMTSLAAVDWDKDQDIDLIVISPDNARSGYCEQVSRGRFRWREFPLAFRELGRANTVLVGDVDGNHCWDLISVGTRGVRVIRTWQIQPYQVRHLATVTPATEGFRSGTVWDFDRNGLSDLLVWSESSLVALRRQANNKFDRIDSLFPDKVSSIADVSVGDLDQDGDADIFVATAAGILLFENVELATK